MTCVRLRCANRTYELYFASGGSNIRSDGSFTISKTVAGVVSVSGNIIHNWSDPYDWHAGLAAYIPGFGGVSDLDAICLEKRAGAKSFNMKSSWTRPYYYVP